MDFEVRLTSATTAPTLLSERLRLRVAVAEDFDSVLAMSCDDRVYRYIGGKPGGRTQAWEKFLRGPGMWSLLGYGLWIVEERYGGAFVGQLGFGRSSATSHRRYPMCPRRPGCWSPIITARAMPARRSERRCPGRTLICAPRYAASSRPKTRLPCALPLLWVSPSSRAACSMAMKRRCSSGPSDAIAPASSFGAKETSRHKPMYSNIAAHSGIDG